MKKLAAFLNDYVLECDWKDMALIKTCVCAFGVMHGLTVKKRTEKTSDDSQFFDLSGDSMLNSGAFCTGTVRG